MNVEKLVEEIAPQVRETVLAEMTKNLASSLTWDVRNAIQEQVSKYVIESVLPDVHKQLQAEHPKIVAAMVEAVQAIAEPMKEAMLRVVTKQLSDDYAMREIMKKLFWGY